MAATREQVEAELEKLDGFGGLSAAAARMVLRDRMTAGQVDSYYANDRSDVDPAVYDAALAASYWLTGAMGPDYPAPSAMWD